MNFKSPLLLGLAVNKSDSSSKLGHDVSFKTKQNQNNPELEFTPGRLPDNVKGGNLCHNFSTTLRKSVFFVPL